MICITKFLPAWIGLALTVNPGFARLHQSGNSTLQKAAIESSSPVLRESLFGVPESTSIAGWSMIIVLDVSHPRRYATGALSNPISISSSGGSWPSAIAITVRNENSQVVKWPLHLATSQAKPTLLLSSGTSGRLVWWLDEQETASVPAGTYRLSITLDTSKTATPTSWSGTASTELTIRIEKARSQTVREEVTRLLLLANLEMIRGRSEASAAALEQILVKDPQNLDALCLKGDLLAKQGKNREAMASYESAMELFSKESPPPPSLTSRYHDLMLKMLRGR